MNFSPDIAHERILSSQPLLAFDPSKDFSAQRERIRTKFLEVLGEMPEKSPPNVRIEYEKEYKDFSEKRIIFNAEKDVLAVCHLWIPKLNKEKYPLIVCLQGHTTGMHISMGRAKFLGDRRRIKGERDFAVQAIRQGYAALILEQRGFGERRTEKTRGKGTACHVTAMTALLIGRTIIGERVWDISGALDAVSRFESIDMEKVACVGNSGGGTAAYYAACFDDRIKAVMPSCSVCTYKDSIAARKHCVCNYIPNAAKYFDMGDLAMLTAPKKLIVVAGKKDKIFPSHGVSKAYETIQKVYKAAGCGENCRLVWGEKGHRFYARPAWEAFREMTNW